MRTHLDIRHEGSLGSDDRVKMTFDEDSIDHLMSVLIDLYSDRELAVIREYSTNALDAHREAGNPAPIEITLPRDLEPTFVVKDRGVGMSVDQITHQFSKYGWSSKRDTDDQVGMLGLGCKSGLTYSSQFTMVSVRDGVKATVLITREATGAGAVQVVDTCATDEPNGVEVRVPVVRPYFFNQKVHDFFRFWDKSTVLVDGEPPTIHISDLDGVWLDPDVFLSEDLDDSYIVMGGVAYPVPEEHSISADMSGEAVVFVPIGAVSFTPSREALRLTKRTLAVLDDARDFIANGLRRKAQAEVDAAKDHAEAITIARKWESVKHNLRLVYKGDVVRFYFAAGDRALMWWRGYVGNPSTRLKVVTYNEAMRSDAILVHGHNGRTFTQIDKSRLTQFAKDNGIDWNTVIVTHDRIGSPWLDGARWFDWADIKGSTKLPKQKRSTVMNAQGEIRVLHYGEIVWTDPTKLTGDLVFVDASRYPYKDERRRLYNSVRGLPVAIVPVPTTKIDKFREEFPDVKPMAEYAAGLRDLFVARLTPEEMFRMKQMSLVQQSGLQRLWRVRGQIFDPNLAAMVRHFGDMKGINSHQWDQLVRLCDRLHIAQPIAPSTAGIAARFTDIQKKYPLLTAAGTYYAHHSVQPESFLQYVNLVHASETNPTDDPWEETR